MMKKKIYFDSKFKYKMYIFNKRNYAQHLNTNSNTNKRRYFMLIVNDGDSILEQDHFWLYAIFLPIP